MIPKKAINHLSKDIILKQVIQNIHLSQTEVKSSVYESLIQSITSQQLSVKAAATIHERFLNLFKNKYPDPKQLIKMDSDTLRSAGLSRQKSGYVQNVAHFFINEKLLSQTNWSKISNEEIITLLTQIKGVGKWTVQMILMFTLDRPDVFPIDDLGIQNAIIKHYDLNGKFSKSREDQKKLYKKMLEIAEPWRPYRTLACRYLWKSI